MLKPSDDHPLPWVKRATPVRDAYSIDAANGASVTIIFDETTADFVVAMANSRLNLIGEYTAETIGLNL